MHRDRQETRRDGWDGNVNHKSLFDSVIHKRFNGVKIGICGLHYHPAIPSCFFFFFGFFRILILCLKILCFNHPIAI